MPVLFDLCDRPRRNRYRGASTGLHDCSSFEVVVAQEHVDHAGIRDDQVIADGVELAIERHLLATVRTVRRGVLLQPGRRAAKAMTVADLIGRPRKAEESFGLAGDWLSAQAKFRDLPHRTSVSFSTI